MPTTKRQSSAGKTSNQIEKPDKIKKPDKTENEITANAGIFHQIFGNKTSFTLIDADFEIDSIFRG